MLAINIEILAQDENIMIHSMRANISDLHFNLGVREEPLEVRSSVGYIVRM